MSRRILVIMAAILFAVSIGIALTSWIQNRDGTEQDLRSDTVSALPPASEEAAEAPAIQIPSTERISLNSPFGELSVKNFLRDDQRFGTTFFVADNNQYWISYQRETNYFVIGIMGSSRAEVMNNVSAASNGLADILDVPPIDLCKLDRQVVRDSEYGRGFSYSILDFPGCANAVAR